MFKKKTLFVVGAGASAEACLPVGDALKGEIADHLSYDIGKSYPPRNGSSDIFNAFSILLSDAANKEIGPFERLLGAAKQIADGMAGASSIDEFLNQNQDDAAIKACGKIAIAHSILLAEHSSKLRLDQELQAMNFDDLDKSWYPRFFRMAAEGVSRGQVETIFENVTFISFNYDRCIEHHLKHALVNQYVNLAPDDADRIVNNLRIFHPYGIVGRLPWQEGEDHKVAFGASDTAEHLVPISKQIKTFTEQIDSQAVHDIRACMQKAEVVIFLGFAFHRQNMELLRTLEKGAVQRIYASTFELSDPNILAVKRSLIASFRLSQNYIEAREFFNMHSGTCADMFDHFRHNLSQ